MQGWEKLINSVEALEHVALNGWQIKGKEEKAKPPSHDPRSYSKLRNMDRRFERLANEIDHFLNRREMDITHGKCYLELKSCVNCERLEPEKVNNKYEGGSGCWQASAKLIARKNGGDWEKILNMAEDLGNIKREDILRILEGGKVLS